MPTSILDPNEPFPAVRERVDQLRQNLQALREAPPQPVEIPPPVTTESIHKKFDAAFPGWRERIAAQREANRREVHPELVRYDDEWKSLIAEWKAAHPNRNTSLSQAAHFYLDKAASDAEWSGDARDLGKIWFDILREWEAERSGSRTRSGGFKCEILKGSDNQETPQQRELRYQNWLDAVRRGKARQKEATSLRKYVRQSGREYEAATTGGSVSVSKSGRKTVLFREAREARARNIERHNQTRLSDKRPATVNLPYIKDKKRSSCEEKVMVFALDQLFPSVDMLYSEWRPDRVSEIGCTWRGNLAKWERDIDVLLKDGVDVAAEFQLQCKGSGYWYVLLRRAIKETGTVIPGRQPKALESLFRTQYPRNPGDPQRYTGHLPDR